MNDNDLETLWLAAFRYYAGRRTYAVSDFCALLIAQWPTLPQKCRFLIERELEWFYAADNKARLDPEGARPLGDDCDRAEWDKVRKLWNSDAWVDVRNLWKGQP